VELTTGGLSPVFLRENPPQDPIAESADSERRCCANPRYTKEIADVHLLGWPAFLAPAGRIAALLSALPPG